MGGANPLQLKTVLSPDPRLPVGASQETWPPPAGVKLQKDAVSSSKQAEAELAAYLTELSDSDRLTLPPKSRPGGPAGVGYTTRCGGDRRDSPMCHGCQARSGPAPSPGPPERKPRAAGRAPGPGGSS